MIFRLKKRGGFMRVKVFKKMYLVILTIFVILMSSSCKNDDPFHAKESGDWIYTIDVCGEGECAILGLSEIGKTREIIVFPTEIEGLKVVKYGKQKGYKFSPDIVFDNCKKIYCNYSYITIRTSIIFGNQEMVGYFPHKFSGSTMNPLCQCEKNSNATLYLSQDLYDYNKNIKNWVERECLVANIEYYLDDKNCFFVDNVEKGKIEIIPPKPFKDDLIFDGWYYNDIEWDFVNNLVEDYLDENNRLRLVAKWEKDIDSIV